MTGRTVSMLERVVDTLWLSEEDKSILILCLSEEGIEAIIQMLSPLLARAELSMEMKEPGVLLIDGRHTIRLTVPTGGAINADD